MCFANQLAGFSMRETLAFNGLKAKNSLWKIPASLNSDTMFYMIQLFNQLNSFGKHYYCHMCNYPKLR